MDDYFTLPDLEADHGFVIERRDSVSSTQDVLRRRLEVRGDVGGVVVRAAQQTAGRGRRGNPWNSAPGGSYQSIGLSPAALESPPGTSTVAAALLPLALAVGVATTLGRAGAQVLVKWPNDLVLGGRKLGGIIVEVVAGTPLVGIGVNVSNDVPDSLAALRGWDVDTVSDLVLLGVRHSLLVLGRGPEAVCRWFATVDWLRDKSVELAGRPEPLRARGIDVDGCLVLTSGTGATSRACTAHVLSVDGVQWSR